jgi:HSP20 family protein
MANLTRWDPLSELTRFSQWEDPFDSMMRRMLRPVRARADEAIDIAIDVNENDNGYFVRADIPGVNKDDISVSIDGSQVSISAQMKKETEKKEGEKVLRTERYCGSMMRSFSLPTDVDAAKADAKYSDGVLELTLPKKTGGGSKRLAIQ